MPLFNPQLLVDHVARKRRRMIVLLGVSNIAVAMLLAALGYLVLSSSRDSYTAQAKHIAEGLVAIAAVNIGSELGQVDVLIRATADELQRLQSSGSATDQLLQDVLASRIKLLKGVEALRLSDAAGLVRWGNALPPGAPMNVSDRDYFKQAIGYHEDASMVTGPLRSKVSGNWVMVFARPISVGGHFNGIVYVSIAADHFRNVFDRYELADKDAMTLRRDDLRLLARRSPGSSSQGEVGATAVSDELRATLAENPSSGSYVAMVAMDGVERTTAYRAVEGWPFVVYAGLNNERFFKPWVKLTRTVSLLTALAWGLVAMATLIVYRASGGEARAMQALAGQTRRTQALLRIAGDGIHIVDHTGRLVEMSDSFAQMLRSSRERLIGRHVSSWDVNQDETEIAAWLAKIKDGDKQRVDVQHRRDDGTVIDVELQISAAEIEGELLIFGSGRDITEVKRLVREQTAMLESDLVGMVKIEHRTIVWRNQALERILAYAPGELAGQPARVLYADEETFRQFGEKVDAVINSGVQHRSQIQMRRKTGEAVWIDLSGVRLTASLSFWMAVDITVMKEAHENLTHVAFHDALTQLPNRLLLADRLKQCLGVAKREQTRVAVCYMDLDGFKAVNDELGHDAGDALLVEVARRLSASIRPADTAARLGGDEFVLVLASLAADEWRRVLDRVVQALSQPVQLPSGSLVKVGVTIGVALSDLAGSRAEELVERADQMMLSGKRSGKGQIFF